jgi:hypothetical protein
MYGFVKLGDLTSAVAEMDDVLDTYPRNSCYYPVAQTQAVLHRTEVFCIAGEEDAALEGYKWLLSSPEFNDEIKREYQGFMKVSGHYNGTIDGQFGDKSKKALEAWVLDGCPGVKDLYIQ